MDTQDLKSHQDKFMVVTFGFEDIFGYPGEGMPLIERELADYNYSAVLMFCAKAALHFTQKGDDPDRLIELAKQIFPQETIDRIIRKYRQTGAAKWMVFDIHTPLNLIKLAAKCCPSDSGKNIGPEDFGKISKWLLILNGDYTAPTTARILLPERSEGDLEELRTYLTRIQFQNSNERYFFRICRNFLIIKNFESKPGGMDLEKLFIEATGGITMQHYGFFCIALMTHWLKFENEGFDVVRDWSLDVKEFFKLSHVPEDEIRQLFDLVCINKEELNSLYAESVKGALGGRDAFVRNFLVFNQRPLQWYDDTRVVCPSLERLVVKASEGIYWILHEYLKANATKRGLDELPISWGSAFEKYANERVQNAFGEDSTILNPKLKSGEELCDTVAQADDFVALFEHKTVHWPYRAQITGRLADMESTLHKLIAGPNDKKGIKQLYAGIKVIQKDASVLPFHLGAKKLLPILVVEGGLPKDDYLNRRLHEKLVREYCDRIRLVDVLPFIILDCEELELCELISQLRGKEFMSKVLYAYSCSFIETGKLGIRPNSMPFKNFLHMKNIKITGRLESISEGLESLIIDNAPWMLDGAITREQLRKDYENEVQPTSIGEKLEK